MLFRRLPHCALSFSNILGKEPAYTKGSFKKKNISEGLIKWCLCDILVLLLFFFWFSYKSICCGYSFELYRLFDKSMQFKWVPTTYAFIKKWTKSALAIFWRLRNGLTERLLGLCEVIRSNTVYNIEYIWAGRKRTFSQVLPTITKTRLFKYTENFTTKKMKIFR